MLLSTIGISSTLASMVMDALLYFLSYNVQERWVFKGEAADE